MGKERMVINWVLQKVLCLLLRLKLLSRDEGKEVKKEDGYVRIVSTLRFLWRRGS